MQQNHSPEMAARTRRTSLRIANKYLQGDLSYGETVKRLTTRGSFGHLLAGEVSVEEARASTTANPYLVSSYMNHAKVRYNQALKASMAEPADLAISNKIRAGLRLAQLGVLTHVFQKQQIPPHQALNSMYQRITRLGIDTLSSSPDIFTDKQDQVTEVKGTLAEIAILALAQRHAIRETSGEEWLPLQSTFSEDHGGDCTRPNLDNQAWDISIFTQYQSDDPLGLTYKIQAKTNLSHPRSQGAVTMIGLVPDLQLDVREGPKYIIPSILHGCQFEHDYPARAQRITDMLDQRTSQLLDVID